MVVRLQIAEADGGLELMFCIAVELISFRRVVGVRRDVDECRCPIENDSVVLVIVSDLTESDGWRDGNARSLLSVHRGGTRLDLNDDGPGKNRDRS